MIALISILCLVACLHNVLAEEDKIVIGDMLLTQKKYDAVYKPSKVRLTNIALEDRWVDGKVAYTFKADFPATSGGTDTKQAVRKALDTLESTTCLRFVPRTTEADFIEIGSYGGCWSWVGRNGGMQTMSLSPGCYPEAIIIHEVLHAMGFLHEQCRPDRDDYIIVHMGNITADGRSQYEKQARDSQSEMAYGYNNVMHYESWGFQISPGQKTMEAIDPQYQPLLDEDLHQYLKCDAERVNVLYNCTNLITKDPSCYKGGVVPTTPGGGPAESTTGGYDYYYYYYGY